MDFSRLPLRDMQVPEAIGWWPLAPGWWLLLVLCVALLGVLFLYLRRKLQDPRRAALQELKKIEQQFASHQDKQQLLMDCNTLLKRLALTLYPRSDVASLSGQQWLTFLKESNSRVDAKKLEVLVYGPYQPAVDLSSDDLVQSCRGWIKQVQGASNV